MLTCVRFWLTALWQATKTFVQNFWTANGKQGIGHYLHHMHDHPEEVVGLRWVVAPPAVDMTDMLLPEHLLPELPEGLVEDMAEGDFWTPPPQAEADPAASEPKPVVWLSLAVLSNQSSESSHKTAKQMLRGKSTHGAPIDIKRDGVVIGTVRRGPQYWQYIFCHYRIVMWELAMQATAVTRKRVTVDVKDLAMLSWAKGKGEWLEHEILEAMDYDKGSRLHLTGRGKFLCTANLTIHCRSATTGAFEKISKTGCSLASMTRVKGACLQEPGDATYLEALARRKAKHRDMADRLLDNSGMHKRNEARVGAYVLNAAAEQRTRHVPLASTAVQVAAGTQGAAGASTSTAIPVPADWTGFQVSSVELVPVPSKRRAKGSAPLKRKGKAAPQGASGQPPLPPLPPINPPAGPTDRTAVAHCPACNDEIDSIHRCAICEAPSHQMAPCCIRLREAWGNNVICKPCYTK